jgi:hypothetical protein
MNKKQLNTLSASLSKALSPPSRKKIELSARIIDQVQPLPGILSRAANSEPEQKRFLPQLGKTPAVHGSLASREAPRSEARSWVWSPSTHSLPGHSLSSLTPQVRLARLSFVKESFEFNASRTV